MKTIDDGRLITISDRPYWRWAIGVAMLALSPLLAYIAISTMFRDDEIFIDLGILITAFVVGGSGFLLIWKYPQIVCEINTLTQSLSHKTTWIWRKHSTVVPLEQVKRFEVAENYAWTGDDFEKYRVEFILHDETRFPVSSRWRRNRKFCQEVADKLNSSTSIVG